MDNTTNQPNYVLDETKTLSDQEYVDYITTSVQRILDDRFATDHPSKRVMRIKRDIIMFACPVCGDSATNSSKKRGCLIIKGKYANFYKCHNCGHFCSVINFLKRHNVSQDLSVVEYIHSNTQEIEQQSVATFFSMFDVDEINKYAFPRDTFKRVFNLVEIEDNERALKYIKGRLQIKNKMLYLYSPKIDGIYILNLTNTGKIVGYQIRHFKGSVKYTSGKISAIYSSIPKIQHINVPEYINTISNVFNILNVDISKPVVVTEGPFDAFLLGKKMNAIAIAGLNKGIPIPLSMMYIYDDDVAGRTKAVCGISKGDYVFLWGRLKVDMNLPNREKWDITDLFLYCYKNGVNVPNLKQYFSNDVYDTLDI